MKRITIIFLIALLTTPTLGSENKYVLVNFYSNGLVVNTASGTKIGGGDIEKTQNGEIEIFSKKSCVQSADNKIKEMKEFESDFIYHDNGVYEISGNFGRLCCVPYEILGKEYVGRDPLGTYIKTDKFFTKYHNKVSSEIDISSISMYSLFPFD